MGNKASKLPPDKLKEYLATTAFNEDELKLWYKFFIRDCPTGEMSIQEFSNIYRLFYPQGQPDQFAKYVFRVFDLKKDGKIDFDEFVKALSKTAKGSTEDKLQWAFNLYDLDGDGRVSRQEMLTVVDSIYMMSGREFAQPDVRGEACQTRVATIFQAMDMDKDDYLSWEEFKEGAQYDPQILRSLEWDPSRT